MVDSLGGTKCSNLNPIPQLGHVNVGICFLEASPVGPWRVDPLEDGTGKYDKRTEDLLSDYRSAQARRLTADNQ